MIGRGLLPYMASPREAKNSSETSSKVKVLVGFERSLLLKVRTGVDLFNMPFLLFFFLFFSCVKLALAVDWQILSGTRLGVWDYKQLLSVFVETGWGLGPVKGNQLKEISVTESLRSQGRDNRGMGLS